MIGKRVLHYEILEELGRGGMGVVYKAEDTKLKRDVALKFLPPEMLRDAEARQRFIHEAQAASALDHTNLCTIYEIGETEDGQMFIAMADYAGQSLKERIGKGPLPVSEAVEIAMQIAQGLGKAHSKGIVHRDIKPANILLTEDGEVKILDFGLAKLGGRTAVTKEGTTLGTVVYMSPEQARGEEVDRRTDIWALGVVLYEMLIGKSPFEGEYDQAIMYAIINEAPQPVTGLRSGIPMGLERIINNALEKDVELRYQTMDDLLADLKRERRDSSMSVVSTAGVASAQKRMNWWKLVAPVAFVLLIALIVLLWKLLPQKALEIIPPTHKQLTYLGNAWGPEISPDGNFLAYLTEKPGVNNKLMIQDLAGGNALLLFEAKNIVNYQWAPDGRELFVMAVKDSVFGNYIIPRLGGNIQKLQYLPIFAISPDGSRYAGGFLPSRRISFVDRKTGVTTSIPLHGNFTWFADIDWSLRRDNLLFLTQSQNSSTLWRIGTDGEDQTKLWKDSLAISSPRWNSQGDAIYFLSSKGGLRDLMKLPVDLNENDFSTQPKIIQSGLPIPSGMFSISPSANQIFYARGFTSSNLYALNTTLKDSIPTKLTSGTRKIYGFSVSPDGKQIALSMGDTRTANIYVMPLEGGQMKQLTFFKSFNASPAWSPDGRWIAFGSNEGGNSRVWRILASGGSPRGYARTNLSNNKKSISWAPGEEILYQMPGNRNFMILNPRTEVERTLVGNDSVGWMFSPKVSPGKKMVAVFWNRRKDGKKMRGLWVISLQDSSQTWLNLPGYYPINWSKDSGWLYTFRPEEEKALLRVRVQDGKIEHYLSLPFEAITSLTMTPDEKTIVANILEWKSDIWMMENFDPEITAK